MKKVLKSSLSLFLAIALIFGSAAVGLTEFDLSGLFAVKASATSEDYLTFGLSENQYYVVYSCDTSASGDIVVPSTYNGLPVKSIWSEAFRDCVNITSITIPDTIVEISLNAFNGCSSLEGVYITDLAKWCNIDFCGYYANPLCYANNFYLNGKLITDLVIPDNVTTICEYAFFGCSSFVSVTIPDSVTNIGYYAFNSCSSLELVFYVGSESEWTNITIDGGNSCLTNKSVRYNSLVYAPSFVYFNENNSITLARYIGTDINVIIPSSIDGLAVTTIGDFAFRCSNIVSVSIPDSVNAIKLNAFGNCINLTSITIPDSVTNIGGYAFDGCTNLGTIMIPNSVASISIGVFNGTAYYNDESNWVDNLLYIGNHLIAVDTSILGNCEVREGTKTISGDAFYGCTNLTSITIPDSVTSIGYDAFYNCTNLEEVTTPCRSYASTYFEESKLKLIHNPTGEWIVDETPTCSLQGSKYRLCSRCSDIAETGTVEPLSPEIGCTFGLWQIETEPTCSSVGLQSRVCTSCGYKEISEINKLSHTISNWIITEEATCTENGTKIKKCTVCGTQTSSSTIYATGHSYGEWYDEVPSTCSSKGHHTHMCITCNYEQTVETGLKSHSYGTVEVITPSTCSVKGSGKHVCEDCGITEYISLPLAEHSYVLSENNSLICENCGYEKTFDFVITTDETITLTYTASREFEFVSSDNSIARVTSVSDSIISSGSYYKQTTNATITPIKPGEITVKVVASNGTIITTSSLLVIEGSHQFVYVSTTIEATCEETGSEIYKCKFCGYEESRSIPALGHTEEIDDAVAPTCTTSGLTEGSHCSVCGDMIVAQTIIDATGHTSSDWIVFCNATCTDTGLKYKKCINCGMWLENEEIPATGHTLSGWIVDVPASVDAPGMKHKECTVCGETLETLAIPQLKPTTPKATTENALNGVLVKWNAVTGATKYQVYRRQGGQTAWTLVGTTTGTSLTDTKVSSGIYYVYSVRAYNNAGQYSDFVSANTQTRKYMAVPKLKGISNATNGLYITWNPVAGVTNGYRVYRRGAGSTYWTYLGTTKNTYFTDTQVKNNSGEYFRYTVIADGGYHSKFDTTGLYLRRLSNPTLKSAVSSKTGITVKWTPVKGCLGYYVYRKTANSGWQRIAVVNGANASSYIDKTAKKGVTYTYTVRAVCGSYISYFNSGISCKDKY